MTKKGLIALLALLVVITACSPGTVTPKDDENTSTGTNPGEKIVAVESDLEYCKMILKTLQAQVNTFDRQEKTIQSNIDGSKKKIADLKAKGDDEKAIKEEQADLDDLNARVKEAKTSLTDANKALADANTKCTKIAKKSDKTICKQFEDNLQEQTKTTQAILTKEEANLENLKKQYDTAKAADKSSEFLASIDEEKQQKNLEILKIKNTIDKLGQMAAQLDERCK